MSDKGIIFLGTPDFAVASLKALVEAGIKVLAVVTMPDKPAGRGQKLYQSPVKQYALSQNLPVLQPEKLRAPAFLAELAAYQAELQVVVAFRMLPELVWNMPPLGTYNLHASLLPQYRGAAPINWAIINGEEQTGITTFRLKHEIDTGDLAFQETVAIRHDMNAGELHDLLMEKGAALMLKTVLLALKGEIQFVPQQANPQALKHAPKLFKADCQIDWQAEGEQVYNLIRGLSPYPAAFSTLFGDTFKIYKASFRKDRHFYDTGSFLVTGDSMEVAVSDGWMRLLEVQAAGKKRMPIADFLRGNRLPATGKLGGDFASA
ncbi:MAG: methionyl-tRNA formyltransferase [Bacteroidia bacterium]